MFIHCEPLKLPNLVSETMPDGKRYYTTPSGIKLPSVTTVVGAMKNNSLSDWRAAVGEKEANRVSRFASRRGNGVHNLAEKYIKNEIVDTKSEMPHVAAMFNSIKPYFSKIDNVHFVEQTLWSERIGLAGRVDLIAEWEGTLSVIDYKTSKKVKTLDDVPEYLAQCVAYSLMYKELIGKSIDQFVILMGVENSKPIVFVEKVREYIPILVQHIKYYKENV